VSSVGVGKSISVFYLARGLLQPHRLRDRRIEHPAESRTIDRSWLHGEADDAAGKLIHHDHHPVRLEDQRFTTKQIETPKAVLGVSEEREPGQPVGVTGRPRVFFEATILNSPRTGVSRLFPELRECRILYQRVAFSSDVPSTTNLPRCAGLSSHGGLERSPLTGESLIVQFVLNMVRNLICGRCRHEDMILRKQSESNGSKPS
jgi:hypothetical protein